MPPEELPPLPEICECQIQGLGSILAITLPPIPPIIEYTLINLNICPNCTPENSSLEYVYTLFIPNQPLVIIFLELEEITTVDCENEEEATIEGTGLVNEEDCEFTLEVSEEGPGSFIMDMTITCGGEIIHEREAELEGTINITEC
ncbi:hypothetical protein [Fuchsiella alkaliacetigena]|uniref:hypothetical protein n=1 Tax=Fuchsiella alkaliacetigena TaxID=957042 RepID=UPI00200B3229|nr:hypothetical protein [Fuchsiella alkaliacetigena]